MKQKRTNRNKRAKTKTKRQKLLQGDLYKNITPLINDHPCKDTPILAERWRLWMYLRRLYHTLDVAFEKELKGFGLTPAQFTALLTVITINGLSMSDLADLCLWNRSTASRITHSLQKKGLILIAPVDGKTSALTATTKGKQLANRYLTKEAGIFMHSLTILTEENSDDTTSYNWLKDSIEQLIGKDVTEYVENVYQHIRKASSP